MSCYESHRVDGEKTNLLTVSDKSMHVIYIKEDDKNYKHKLLLISSPKLAAITDTANTATLGDGTKGLTVDVTNNGYILGNGTNGLNINTGGTYTLGNGTEGLSINTTTDDYTLGTANYGLIIDTPFSVNLGDLANGNGLITNKNTPTNNTLIEIKPDDEMIEKQIKGDSKNGNAITGKDGKALGNVSKRSEKVGERFKKNFDENLYGAEQMNVSYKRQPQPVDIAGDKKQSGGLKKGSTAKAEKIMNQLESTEDKKAKIVSEEMNKMKNLISYDRKTQ